MSNQQGELKSDLKIRHISMISIAGVIGAGLFIGSGAVINSVGPGSILSYTLAGLIVVLVMRMLGEMAAADQQVDPFQTMRVKPLGHGQVIHWLVILVFLDSRYCDRSCCRCSHYSILAPRLSCMAYGLDFNGISYNDELIFG